jgi:hypothetical protein
MALKLQPNPTFSAKVEIPVPGQDQPEVVDFIFAHMDRDEFKAFTDPEVAAQRSDMDSLRRIVRGWGSEVDAPFSDDALAKLIKAYHGAAYAISAKFVAELTKARLGN